MDLDKIKQISKYDISQLTRQCFKIKGISINHWRQERCGLSVFQKNNKVNNGLGESNISKVGL